MLSAADRALGDPVDVVVGSDGPATDEADRLRAAAARPYAPDLVLTSVAQGEPQAAWPLYAGKVARHGRATAYACRGYACDEPTSDPDRLEQQVCGLAGAAQPAR
jgi:uncharacterized protein YyaL (SSP411 family)